MTDERRLPERFSVETANKALSDSAALSAAFYWRSTQQGHDFWEKQRDDGLTEEGRAALLAMLAAHAANQTQDVFTPEVAAARNVAWSETNYMELYQRERARVAELEAELSAMKGREAA